MRIPLLAVGLWIAAMAPECNAQVVVAHAGGKAHGPENTLPTISESFDVGATWVEVDVRLTLDAVAMLMHDSTVDRTTNGSGPIGLMSLASVKSLDAGSYFGPEFIGTQVPTFEEALDEALGRGPVLVDMKDGVIGSQVAAALSSLGAAAGDIVWWATSTAEVIEAQTHLPGSRIFYQIHLTTEPEIQLLSSLGVDGVSISYSSLTPALVDVGHNLALDVFVWGANDRPRIAEALFFGVDGIHHTNPQFVLDFLSEADCSDNADNDQDGFLDFPDDPGCFSLMDNSEKSTVGCDDGIDNDADGFVDFPYDPGCANLLDDSEGVPLVVCGDGILTASESCDDSGTTPGDGCDAVCQIESGWSCSGAPSSCSPVTAVPTALPPMRAALALMLVASGAILLGYRRAERPTQP